MLSGFAAALAARDRDELTALLRSRPDLAVPAPRDISALASRACQPGSLQRALETLDAFAVQVLDGVLLLPEPVERAELEALLPDADLTRPLERLTALGLLWADSAGFRAPRALRSMLPKPAGLGRSARELHADWYNDADLNQALRSLTDQQRGVLILLADDNPFGTIVEQTAELVGQLVELRLLLPVNDLTVELPREVALLVRGAHPLGAPKAALPAVTATRVETDDADQAGASESSELLRLAGDVLRGWSAAPAATLRSGGLGVRELRALARQLDQSDQVAAILVEVLHGAGLLDQDAGKGSWMPTSDYDRWVRRPPSQRWARLAASWLDLPRNPALIGERDDRDRPIAALSPQVTSWSIREIRRHVLAALAALPAGTAPDASALAEVLAWQAPMRPLRWRRIAEPILAEAALLGITGRGALTSHGRALLAGGSESAASCLDGLLPEPLDYVLLQADLTAVAPGPLRGDLADELGLLADIESAGNASVYRFSEASLRRGLDSGRTTTDILAFLTTLSRTPVPQPLEYLVTDVSRRYGRLRTAPAASYLRADDHGLLAEVVALPAARVLGLRRIAPTVAISTAGSARVLEVLRSAGYAPVGENQTGGAVVGKPISNRTPARPRWSGPERSLSSGQLEQLVDRILEGTAAAAADKPPQSVDVSELMELLTQAAAEGRAVEASFLDRKGELRRERLRPLSVLDGTLVAVSLSSGTPMTVPLRRMSSVSNPHEEP